jgi:hypothetical protein
MPIVEVMMLFSLARRNMQGSKSRLDGVVLKR